MQPLVILIGKTEIDWTNYLGIARQALGHSISQGIDSNNIEPNTLAAFISTLSELFNSNGNPITSLRDAGCLIDHINFSYLVISDTSVPFYLLQNSNLRIHIKETLVSGCSLLYVSGSLMVWRESIINLTTGSEPHAVRLVIDKIMLIFEQEGFKEIFFNYKKQMLPDKTFKLIEKQ